MLFYCLNFCTEVTWCRLLLLDNCVIYNVVYCFYIVCICRCYDCRHRNAVFVCQNMPFCAQFAPISRITSCHCPPKGDFMDIPSRDCQFHLIPFLLSYSFNSPIHILLKTSNLTHSRNLLWHVEPEPYSPGSIFHWHPVLRT